MLSGTKLCITVDDLPLHGPAHTELSRRDIARLFLSSFEKHQIAEVIGFANGGMTMSSGFSRLIKLGDCRILRRLLSLLQRFEVVDPRPYLNGQFPESDSKHIEILNDWVKAGHILGNHTYFHSNLTYTDSLCFINTIKRNADFLKSISSADCRYFRYPYLREGETRDKRDKIRAYLDHHNYVVAPVTVDFADWAWNRAYLRQLKNGCSAAKLGSLAEKYIEMAVLSLKASTLVAQKLFRRDIMHVLVLHLGAFTGLILDRLLTQYNDLGVSFISMEEVLTDPIYKTRLDINLVKGTSFLGQCLVAQGLPPILLSRDIFYDKQVFKRENWLI